MSDSHLLKIALIQMNSGSDKTQNIQQALAFCQEALSQNAQFICLPELFHCRCSDLSTTDKKEPIPGPSLTPFMTFAQRHQISILAGSIFESVLDRKRAYNTSCLIDPSGTLSAIYRKIHLFDVTVDHTKVMESASFIAGESPVIGDVFHRKLGLSICYDLRFPELYRSYANAPVDMISVPSAFTKTTGSAHWHTLLRARAIENQCFVLAPNQVGHGAYGIESYGHSLVVDPWGSILAEGSEKKEEVITATLDFNVLTKIRQKLPALKHRRLRKLAS